MKMTINIENKVIAEKNNILVSKTESDLFVVAKHNKANVVLNSTELTFYEEGTKVPKNMFRHADNEELVEFIMLLMKFTKDKSLDKVF